MSLEITKSESPPGEKPDVKMSQAQFLTPLATDFPASCMVLNQVHEKRLEGQLCLHMPASQSCLGQEAAHILTNI